MQDKDPAPAKNAMDRLDLAIFVPAGVRIDATTSRGLFEARNVRSDLQVRTQDEPITISTLGAVQARSETGAVTAFLQPRDPKLPPRGVTLLESDRGEVTLGVPPDEAFEVRAETAGAITTELPVVRAADGGRNTARSEKAGGALAIAWSRSGAVQLRRTVVS
jgi:hypothetical protein